MTKKLNDVDQLINEAKAKDQFKMSKEDTLEALTGLFEKRENLGILSRSTELRGAANNEKAVVENRIQDILGKNGNYDFERGADQVSIYQIETPDFTATLTIEPTYRM